MPGPVRGTPFRLTASAAMLLLLLAPAFLSFSGTHMDLGGTGTAGPPAGWFGSDPVRYSRLTVAAEPDVYGNFSTAFNSSDTVRGAANGRIVSVCDLDFLQGTGGGHLELSIEGSLAVLLRKRLDDPWFEHGGTGDGWVDLKDVHKQDTEGGRFTEAFEDRLEGTSTIYTDARPPMYDVRFKGMDLRRDRGGGVDINGITGLDRVSVDSREPVVMDMGLKGSISGPDRDILLSDGYVLVYAVFGTAFNVTFREDLSITSLGVSSLERSSGSGSYSRERLVGGEEIRYRDEYNTGRAMSGDGAFEVRYTGFSPFYSPTILFVYMALAFTCYAFAFRHFRMRAGASRNRPFMIASLVLFGIIFYVYHTGTGALLLMALLAASTATLVLTSRMLYPPIYGPGGPGSRPIATGHLMGPGETGGMCTPVLDDGSGEEQAGGEVQGWEMLHVSAHRYYRKGNNRRAMELIDAGLKLDPGNHMLLNDKGYILMKRGRHDDALECFKLALKYEPDFSVSRVNITRCLLERDL